MKVLTESKRKVRLPVAFLVHYAKVIRSPRRRRN